jgi:competence protein ComEA
MKKLIIVLGVVLLAVVTFSSVAFAKSNQTEKTTTTTTTDVINYVYVDVKGEVEYPGVYRVSDKCRIFQVIEIAGGLKETSDTTSINLSAKIRDELVINVPKNSKDILYTGLININTATATELDLLPGVGYSTATNIIDYRNTNGSFKTKEEIKSVNGIGDVIYDQIKDLITI